MAIYKSPYTPGLVDLSPERRISNQIIISGTNDSFSAPNGIVLIELLQIEAGKTITIQDGDGTQIASGVTSFDQEISPLRCDKGFTITGDVEFGKASVIYGVLP